VTNLLTAKQAADDLGVDRRTITRWVETGKLAPAMKLTGTTGAYLFDRDAIVRLKAEVAS
jgi:excisionase family DNA binding protein